MQIEPIPRQIEHESMQGAIHQFMGEIIIHTQGTEKAQFVGIEHAPIQRGQVIFQLGAIHCIYIKHRTHRLQTNHNHCIAVRIEQVCIKEIATRKRVQQGLGCRFGKVVFLTHPSTNGCAHILHQQAPTQIGFRRMQLPKFTALQTVATCIMHTGNISRKCTQLFVNSAFRRCDLGNNGIFLFRLFSGVRTTGLLNK